MTGLQHNKTAQIIGEFSGISMNYIIFRYYNWINIMHRTVKNPKKIPSLFSISKGTKRGHESFQNFP